MTDLTFKAVKKYLFSLIVVCCFVLVAKAQPGPTTYTLNPQPVNGQYSTGTIVTLCYTMTGFGGCGTAEWFEGFDLNLGPGWVNVAPVTAPADCGGAAGGGAQRGDCRRRHPPALLGDLPAV